MPTATANDRREPTEAFTPRTPPQLPAREQRAYSFSGEGDMSYVDRDIPQGSFIGQFAASVKKNVLQKVRDPVSCCLEITLPLLFICGLLGIWAATSTKSFPAETFLNSSQPMLDMNGIRTLFCSNSTNLTAYTPCSLLPSFATSPVYRCVLETNNEMCFNATLATSLVYYWLNDWSNAKAVPTLDQMIHFMWLAKTVIPKGFADAQYQSVYSAVVRAGKLHFIANNGSQAYINQLIQYFDAKAPVIFQRYVLGNTYTSQVVANSYVENVDTEGTVWGMVALNEVSATEIDFSVQLNRSGVPWTNRVQDRFTSGGLGQKQFRQYYASGFLSLQATVNEFWFEVVKGATPPNELYGAPMPYVFWKQSTFLQVAGQLAPLLIVLSFLYPVSQQTKRIVEEKERRVREAMMIMGLGTGGFYASWVVTYAMLYFVTSVGATILLKVTFAKQADTLILFFMYYFFCLSCISLSGALSAFFSKSRLAATMAPLIFFVVSVPFFAIGDTTPRGPLLLLSLLSPSAFSIGCSLVFDYEMGTGISAKDMASTQDTLNMATVYFFLLFDAVWYFLLALYLDGVLPAEWGSREHPCFCYLRCFRLCSSAKGQPEGVLNDARDPRGQYEPDPKGRPSVMLRGLRRVFERGNSRFVAVNDLTLNLYEGQITVLLGHNGAGKTTAINLMTGMLDPTAGDCVVYGKSIHTDMAAVRQEIGFCPQHNILWPELTCREHLEYFGKLKGLSGEELETAVLEMLKAVDLFDKIDYPSANLSGGQKRKLSVAIAFVGRSRVIFLDEPTAGMDVGARRHTWDLIRRMSVGRTIVLTTHYMDEADLLGHCIAIMSKGRLKCKGSSLFLKSRLGVGYTLSVSVDAAAQFSTIEAIVRQSIPSMDVLGSGSGELAYRLPMAEVPNFPSMLSQLEERGTSLGVRSFGISVTTIEEVFLKIAEDEEENEELVRSPAPLTPQPELPEEDRGNPHAWAQYRNHESPLLRQFRALVIKRFHNIKRDRRTQCFQVVTPVICLLLAMLFTLVKFPNSPNLPLIPAMYGEAVEVVYANCPVWIGKDVFNPVVTAYNMSAASPDALSTYLQDTYKQHAKLRTTAFYCNDSVGGRPFMMFNASRGIHSAPEAMQVYYNAYAKGQGLGVNMAVASWPLPLTARESGFVEAIMSLLIGIFIMIPFTFIPSTFVSWVVKERECKAKHLQTISGMNFAVYWASNFVFDIVSFIITTFLAILVFLIFNRKEYIGGGEQFGATFVLFLLYGLAGVTGSYLTSFAFDNHASAQNVVMLANFICGFLLVLLNYFLVAIESTNSAGKALRYVFRIVPSYCLGEGIINLASHELIASFGNNDPVFAMDVVGWNCLYLAIEFPIFAALTLLLDHPSRQRRAQQLFHEPDVLPPPIPNEDADVVQERIEVETGARPNDVVRIKNLCKVYPTGKGPKVAVKNLSLGVKQGEVFGFLGTNGAGKTTTISILCGEQLPTHGRGWVNGHDVVDDAMAARRAVGYCPQFDALLDLLTAEEHLRLYAGLRGLDIGHIDAVVQSLIQSVGLEEHRKTLAMNMSGGNRRKLSVAVALVGAPLVVFLDEPSAGMDPLARRGLWDVIEAIASKCSVVLTTHHLEEVEALAHRVGIMVNGELRCIGTLQQLKHKFGSGFELSLRVANESRVQGLRTYMASAFPTAVEQEFRSLKFTFALPHDTQLSQTFRRIEDVKEQLAITDYSLSQTSLEQVFLHIGADATAEE